MSRHTRTARRGRRHPILAADDPAHAPGKRTLGPPPAVERPDRIVAFDRRHQPWIPTSGLIGRTRRSARRS